MDARLIVWTQFLVCVAAIGFAGARLIRYGDAIAGHTGLSRNWIGLILVATVTSLPELVSGISAVALAEAPDIAMGNALGSSLFNLAILAMLDIFFRRHALYAQASRGHLLSSAFGVILLASVALVLVLSAEGILPAVGSVGSGSLIIIGLYAVAVRVIYLGERRFAASEAPQQPAVSLNTALIGYILAALVIVAAGIWLPLVGVQLAALMGWSNSFVGTVFIALATTVPEMATTWGALRLGAIDLAMGNLLGSNLFNMLILAVDDLAYQRGVLYSHVSAAHLLTAITGSIMSGAVVVALAYRAPRVWGVGSWASIVLLALYLLNVLLHYLR